MPNAFSVGRLGIWHTSLTSFNPPYVKYKEWGFTDIFFDADDPLLTLAKMDEARGKPSADGKNFRAHIYKVWRREKGSAFAKTLLTQIPKFKPGVAELDFEGPDDNEIGVAVADFLAWFRDESAPVWQHAFPLCINVVPLKGYVLPIARMRDDPNTYGRIQPYYAGEMRPADPMECLEDWLDRGFPRERLSFIYSAKPRRQNDGSIFEDMPVFTDHGVYVRKLRRGAVYNANLMREGGLV
jgi:hypothetical protein